MVTAAPLLLLLGVAQGAPAQPSPPGSGWTDEPAPIVATPAAPPESPPAPAEPPPAPPTSGAPPPGPALIAGGIGIGVPFGTAPEGWSMSQLVSKQLRMALQLGFRVSPEVLLGGYLDGGIGMAGDMAQAGCLGGIDAACKAEALQTGLLGRYAFTPLAAATPWLSIGGGWECTRILSNGSISPFTYSGAEVRLGAGYDYRRGGRVGAGLFLDGSLGWYSRVSGRGGASHLPGQPPHGWVTAGVRLLLLP